MNSTSRLIHRVRLYVVFGFVVMLAMTSMRCKKEQVESAAATPALEILPSQTNASNVPIKEQTEQIETASATAPTFEKPLPLNQIKNITIAEIDQWLGLKVDNVEPLYLSHQQFGVLKCDKTWTKYSIRRAQDWPRKGTHTTLNIYTRDNVTEIIFMYSEEILCPNETREECRQEHEDGGYSIKKTEECSGNRYIDPCDTRINNVNNGTYLNALEPLSEIVRKCDKNIYNKKPIDYQCPNFSISYTGSYDFRRVLTNTRNRNSLETMLHRFKAPTNPFHVQHYGRMIGPDPALIIYRNRNSLIQFFEDAQKAMASEASARKRGLPSHNRKGFYGCILSI